MKTSILTLGAAMAALTACSPQQSTSELESRIKTLEQEHRKLKAELIEHKAEQFLESLDRLALLKPGDEGYSTVQFDLGTLTVQLADVSPYANGSKITLRFGNLTSARVNGMKGKLEWGQLNEKGYPDLGSAKSRDIELSESLGPGAWTSVPLVIEGTPPPALGFVRLGSLGHRGIGLAR
jgi:hypothetical protein